MKNQGLTAKPAPGAPPQLRRARPGVGPGVAKPVPDSMPVGPGDAKKIMEILCASLRSSWLCGEKMLFKSVFE